jgi:hypothetical protein
MENKRETAGEPLKMLANRRVLETSCSICGKGFQMAEEVYQCQNCAGYHHLACWDSVGQCPQPVTMPASGQVGWQSAPTNTVVPNSAQTVPFQDKPAQTLAPDERYCPSCRNIIKQQALKCRICGVPLHSEMIGQIPQHVADEIEERASNALKYSLIGLVCVGFIFEPMAIFNGAKALRLMGQYPDYVSGSSARGKALAGVIIGSIIVVMYVLIIFGNMNAR